MVMLSRFVALSVSLSRKASVAGALPAAALRGLDMCFSELLPDVTAVPYASMANDGLHLLGGGEPPHCAHTRERGRCQALCLALCLASMLCLLAPSRRYPRLCC